MEQILKNSSSFVKVLGMSRTSTVVEWNSESLEWAFQWAEYFEKVYLKLLSRTKQRNMLCNELKRQCVEMKATLGCSVLKFDDLKQARHILAQNILQNIWCTPEIYAQTIRLHYLQTSIGLDNSSLSNDLNSMAKTCETSNLMMKIGTDILRATSRKRTLASNQEGKDMGPKREKLDFRESFSLKARARLLRDVLMQSLKEYKSEGWLKTKVNDISSNEKGVILILEALLLQRTDGDDNFHSLVIHCVTEELFPKWKKDHYSFLSLPISTLVEMVTRNEDLRREYFETLLECCEFFDRQYGEELYLISSLRGNLSPNANKEKFKGALTGHFKELRERGGLDVEFSSKSKYNIDKNWGTRNVIVPSESTWNKLWAQYLSCSSIDPSTYQN